MFFVSILICFIAGINGFLMAFQKGFITLSPSQPEAMPFIHMHFQSFLLVTASLLAFAIMLSGFCLLFGRCSNSTALTHVSNIVMLPLMIYITHPWIISSLGIPILNQVPWNQCSLVEQFVTLFPSILLLLTGGFLSLLLAFQYFFGEEEFEIGQLWRLWKAKRKEQKDARI